MDKKKVIKLIQEVIINNVGNLEFGNDKHNAPLRRANGLLHDALIELFKPDWISVEDELPDIDEKVLVCNEKIPYMWWDSSISSDVADMWKDEHGFLKEDHITHWRKIDKLEV